MSDPNLNRPRPGEPLPGRASIDPNDPIPMEPLPRRDTSGSGMMWGWIAGIAVVVLILAFMFGGTNSQQTADTAPPAATLRGRHRRPHRQRRSGPRHKRRAPPALVHRTSNDGKK